MPRRPLIVTIIFFSVAVDETEHLNNVADVDGGPKVIINGQSFSPNLVDRGDDGRIVIVIDRDDLFVGENTVEIQWGDEPPMTITAELPSESQQH